MYLELIDKCPSVLPLPVFSHSAAAAAPSAAAAALLCSWSISLGAVFRAWGRWEQTEGEGGWLHLLGDLLRGAPPWPGSVFMSVFKGAAPWRGRARKRGRWHISSGAAIVVPPRAPSHPVTVSGGRGKSTLFLLPDSRRKALLYQQM